MFRRSPLIPLVVIANPAVPQLSTDANAVGGTVRYPQAPRARRRRHRHAGAGRAPSCMSTR